MSIRAGGKSRSRLAALTLAGVAIWATTLAASAQSSPAPGGTLFASAKRPYTLVLPTGWRVFAASQEPGLECCDVFEGDGFVARVNAGEVPAGSVVADRVAGNRARDAVEGLCSSDPAEDRATTLGGEEAIAWSNRCGGAFHAIVQAIHDDVSYHMEVDVPIGSEAEAAPILEQLRSTLEFLDVTASPPADLASIEAGLQGTWQTEWAPVEFGFAAIRAAGLDPADGDPGFREWYMSDPSGTARTGVKFDGGDITQYGALNGGQLEVGWFGTYQLVDADTIEATEGGSFNRIVYDFVLRDDMLAIDVVSDAAGDSDLVPQTAIYETLPFTKVP